MPLTLTGTPETLVRLIREHAGTIKPELVLAYTQFEYYLRGLLWENYNAELTDYLQTDESRQPIITLEASGHWEGDTPASGPKRFCYVSIRPAGEPLLRGADVDNWDDEHHVHPANRE